MLTEVFIETRPCINIGCTCIWLCAPCLGARASRDERSCDDELVSLLRIRINGVSDLGVYHFPTCGNKMNESCGKFDNLLKD